MKNKYLKKKLKTYCFDIDGVICSTNGNDYKNSKPIIKSIKKINQLYSAGNIILIFTARFMGRSNDNPILAKKRGYQFTFKQLKKWKLNFHKLIFGKPSFNIIIDDKSIFYRKNWHNKI
jgi:uncharacterized HAD superfamily protein